MDGPAHRLFTTDAFRWDPEETIGSSPLLIAMHFRMTNLVWNQFMLICYHHSILLSWLYIFWIKVNDCDFTGMEKQPQENVLAQTGIYINGVWIYTNGSVKASCILAARHKKTFDPCSLFIRLTGIQCASGTYICNGLKKEGYSRSSNFLSFCEPLN